MRSIKFIAYADIHHDAKAAGCITMQDTLVVEEALHRRVETGGFDFSLFCGDRYLKREPRDEVKVLADRLLLNKILTRSQPHYTLIGNHDWVDNALSWHTSETLMHGCTVFDAPTTWVTSFGVTFHVMPSGFSFSRADYDFSTPKNLNIFVFHDQVCGSVSDDAGTHTFSEGVDLSQLDLVEFDLVLAGDIHVPQQFNLKNTEGGYTGSVLQRTFADAQKARGWLEIEAVDDGTGWKIKKTFVPTRNFFTRYELFVTDTTQYHDLVAQIDDVWVTDQAVELKLTGSKENVDRLSEATKWSNYTNIIGARSFSVFRSYEAEGSTASVDMQESSDVAEDLRLYLASGFVDTGLLKPEKLTDMLANMAGG